MKNLIVKSINAVLLAFFVYAAIMQYNDPDEALWMLIYGSAALLCALYLVDGLPVALGLFESGACLLGALYLLLQNIAPAGFWDSTGQEMVGIREPGREMIGLLIVAAWMGFLTWRVWRRRRRLAGAESITSSHETHA